MTTLESQQQTLPAQVASAAERERQRLTGVPRGDVWLIAKELQRYRSNARKGKATAPSCAGALRAVPAKGELPPFPLRKMPKMLQFF